MMMVAISIKIALQQVQALVLLQQGTMMVAISIKIALQQVQALVLQLAVDQQRQVQAPALQVEVI
jgi:hypothetical protein